VEGIRLVAIEEPVAVAGSDGNAQVASTGRSQVATREGVRHRPGEEIPHGPSASSGAVPDVLDRVMASRLDRVGAAVRWGIGAGGDDASATTHAALALRSARARGTELGFATGDPWRDTLLADLWLVLAALLDDLTPRQAVIAGLILLDGARQAEVAAALGVSRATVSVAVARGRLSAIAGARRAIEALLVGPPAAGPGFAAGPGLGAGIASAVRSR
jgi:DNA-binding CsgD family transcriptional regulator